MNDDIRKDLNNSGGSFIYRPNNFGDSHKQHIDELRRFSQARFNKPIDDSKSLLLDGHHNGEFGDREREENRIGKEL